MIEHQTVLKLPSNGHGAVPFGSGIGAKSGKGISSQTSSHGPRQRCIRALTRIWSDIQAAIWLDDWSYSNSNSSQDFGGVRPNLKMGSEKNAHQNWMRSGHVCTYVCM